jgi:hypothetical protein
VLDLLLNRSDVHHVYPKKHLKAQGLSRGRYNQIANFVLAQSETSPSVTSRPSSISRSRPSSAMAARRSMAASRALPIYVPTSR